MSEAADTAWSPENTAYWAAAREGRLLVKRCTDCGKPHYYPRAHCPFCSSPETVWESASGAGIIHSFTVVRRADPIYCPAYVTLAEGITMITHIVDCDPETLAIGQPVQVVFQEAEDGRMVPMFTPAA